jgi:hypothetical protein
MLLVCVSLLIYSGVRSIQTQIHTVHVEAHVLVETFVGLAIQCIVIITSDVIGRGGHIKRVMR